MTRSRFRVAAAMVGLALGAIGVRARAGESPGAANTKQEQEIHACFQKTPELKDEHIKVSVDDGIAVLEGTVDSRQEKKEAQQLAHVNGILGVNNRLEVRRGEK